MTVKGPHAELVRKLSDASKGHDFVIQIKLSDIDRLIEFSMLPKEVLEEYIASILKNNKPMFV